MLLELMMKLEGGRLQLELHKLEEVLVGDYFLWAGFLRLGAVDEQPKMEKKSPMYMYIIMYTDTGECVYSL